MNVLVTSITFIPSVLLCGHCQLDYLEKQGKLNYRFVIAHFINKKNIEWADVIVFIRSDSDIEAYVSKIAKKNNIHTIYVLDDDLLNPPSYISSFPYYNLPSTKRNMKTIMSNCDTFLTPSPVLLEKYGCSFKQKFLIDEPSLNRITNKESNNKVKIGFAGSIDRAQDINEILKDTISKIVEKYKDSIEIEFFGAKPNFVDKLNLKYIPYQDGYDAYTAYMSKCNWDIGLAPMPKTEFHRCKYFNKYVEYASFGTVGIYSKCEPYIYGIKNGVNGLLVENNTEEWFNALCILIEDEKLRKKMSLNCLKEANDKYALPVLANDYLTKITKGYKSVDVKKTIPSLEPAKFIIFFKRVFRKVKEEGLNFPSWLINKINEKFNIRKENKRYNNNKEKLKQLISTRKSICIFSPFNDEIESEYNKRVKDVDDGLSDYIRIYLDGEDELCENLKVNIIDDKHVSIVFNSFDINQTNEVIELIKQSKNCLIHSVIRFIREKISTEMFRIFDIDGINIIWDMHGNIPEKYHAQANFHTEAITTEIEKTFYAKAHYVLVNNIEELNILENKYGKSEIKYFVYRTSNDDLSKIML